MEADLGKEVAGDPIDLVELGIATAEWAVIGVLCEPVALAVRANGLLANLALKGVLQNVVAHATNQLGKERRHVRLVVDVIFFVKIPRRTSCAIVFVCSSGVLERLGLGLAERDHLLGRTFH